MDRKEDIDRCWVGAFVDGRVHACMRECMDTRVNVWTREWLSVQIGALVYR